MRVNDWIHLIAGVFVLTGVTLAHFINPWFLAIPAFVGLNLFQYGFSGFCPMATILKKLGVPESKVGCAS